MSKTLIRILIAFSLLIFTYLSIVLVASIVQLADAADRVYMGLGQPVFWLLTALFIVVLISPFYLYFKLPKALTPPDETEGPKHEEYLVRLRQRLASNPRLSGEPVNSRGDIESALATLSTDADKVIRATASAVFVSTAIMQNGRLDGLITLVTQAKMVWVVACIFQQRPSPRQMLYLYSNVCASALLAESIDDIDLSEIVAPILGSSLMSAIPGASLIVNSISSGAANAFLTLRVGFIARQYCETLSTPSRRAGRRTATLSAMAMIGSLVKENSGQILSVAWSTIKSVSKNAVDSASQVSKNVAGKVSETVSTCAKTVGSAAGQAVDGVQHVAGKISETVLVGAKSVGDVTAQTAAGAKYVGGKVSETAMASAKSVGNAAGQAVDGTRQVAGKISDKFMLGAKSIGNVVGSTVDVAKDMGQKITLQKK